MEIINNSNYELKKIIDKDTRNQFIIKSDIFFYSFLNSFEWWEFQELEWNGVLRYWIYKNQILIWLCQFVKVFAKRWKYLFVPHWPLILPWYDFFETMNWILEKIKQIWKDNMVDFVRLNPTIPNTKKNNDFFKKIWLIYAPIHTHAEDTHILDLSPKEDELLGKIKKEDRYYIKRAINEWVRVKISNEQDHIDELIKMHQNHANRTNWKNTYMSFSKKYIQNLYKVFWENIKTISTSFDDKIESILMTIKFGSNTVYYIASSDIINKKFSPNYLCQRSAIIEAKKTWSKIYNFWWISPDDNPKHPIYWVSKFKKKFWWFDYSMIHWYDMVITRKYRINRIVESIRRIKRWYYYKKPTE